jgi:hypothetical protein
VTGSKPSLFRRRIRHRTVEGTELGQIVAEHSAPPGITQTKHPVEKRSATREPVGSLAGMKRAVAEPLDARAKGFGVAAGAA